MLIMLLFWFRCDNSPMTPNEFWNQTVMRSMIMLTVLPINLNPLYSTTSSFIFDSSYTSTLSNAKTSATVEADAPYVESKKTSLVFDIDTASDSESATETLFGAVKLKCVSSDTLMLFVTFLDIRYSTALLMVFIGTRNDTCESFLSTRSLTRVRLSSICLSRIVTINPIFLRYRQ